VAYPASPLAVLYVDTPRWKFCHGTVPLATCAHSNRVRRASIGFPNRAALFRLKAAECRAVVPLGYDDLVLALGSDVECLGRLGDGFALVASSTVPRCEPFLPR
jgi:hypothetical protein